MKYKLLTRYLPLAAILTATSSYAAVNESAYFSVQEVAVNNQSGTDLARAQQNIRGAALAKNGSGTQVAANGQYHRSAFPFFDINQPHTFVYDCQYASYVCELFQDGSDKNGQAAGDGFKDYRTSFVNSFSDKRDYPGYFLGMVAPSGASLSKLTLTTNGDANQDIHISDMATIAGVTWITGYQVDPKNNEASKGFVAHLDGSNDVQLTPKNTTSPYGGVSAGYRFFNKSGTWYIAGTTGIDQGKDTRIDECYKQVDTSNYGSGSHEMRDCPGVNTQAAVWPLAGGAPIAVSSGYLNTNHDGYKSAAAVSANTDNVLAGYTSYAEDNEPQDTYARAALYNFNGSTLSRIDLKGNGIIGADDNDDIRDQWAQDLYRAGSTLYVLGNERYTESKGREDKNQAVNFFVDKVTGLDGQNQPTSSSNHSVSWPMKNKPFNGANNQIMAVDHSGSGWAVGMRDAPGETQTSSNGINRRQAAFLYNVTTNQSWSLANLTCAINNDKGTREFYRITGASAVTSASGDLTVLASGRKYSSKQNIEDGYQGKLVLFKLTHTGKIAPSLSDSQYSKYCPTYVNNTGKFKRSGADSFWLFLLLIPAFFVRLVTKKSKK